MVPLCDASSATRLVKLLFSSFSLPHSVRTLSLSRVSAKLNQDRSLINIPPILGKRLLEFNHCFGILIEATTTTGRVACLSACLRLSLGCLPELPPHSVQNVGIVLCSPPSHRARSPSEPQRESLRKLSRQPPVRNSRDGPLRMVFPGCSCGTPLRDTLGGLGYSSWTSRRAIPAGRPFGTPLPATLIAVASLAFVSAARRPGLPGSAERFPLASLLAGRVHESFGKI